MWWYLFLKRCGCLWLWLRQCLRDSSSAKRIPRTLLELNQYFPSEAIIHLEYCSDQSSLSPPLCSRHEKNKIERKVIETKGAVALTSGAIDWWEAMVRQPGHWWRLRNVLWVGGESWEWCRLIDWIFFLESIESQEYQDKTNWCFVKEAWVKDQDKTSGSFCCLVAAEVGRRDSTGYN